MLLSHDEVRVPQLGTFIVKEMQSKRVDEEGIFLPPYRSVAFHQDEMEAGEAFILSLSKIHNLSVEDARVACTEYFDELMQSLHEEGSANVGSMGYLLHDEHSGQISFMPMQSGIASPAYYGLDALSFAKLSKSVRQQRDKQIAQRKTKVTTVAGDSDTITIHINRRLFNYVATVAASVVLFFSFTSPQNTHVSADSTQLADTELFLPSGVLPMAKTTEPVKAELPQAPKAEAATTPAAEANPVEEPVAEVVAETPEKEYVIVIASAISKKSASNVSARLNDSGYKAIACEFGGMTRVIIRGFESMDAANNEIHQLRQECKDFANAWPCRLKDEIKPID